MEIDVKNGKETIKAIIDAEDHERIRKYHWIKYKNGIYTRMYGLMVYLHRFLMNADDSVVVKYRDENCLNNQKANLQVISRSMHSQSIQSTDKKYFGVHQVGKKWRAVASRQNLGSFDTEEEAAKRYDTYVLLKYGPDAKTNGLVKYEDICEQSSEELVCKKRKKELPANIYMTANGKYTVQVCYVVDTLEEAERKLKNIRAYVAKEDAFHEACEAPHGLSVANNLTYST